MHQTQTGQRSEQVGTGRSEVQTKMRKLKATVEIIITTVEMIGTAEMDVEMVAETEAKP